MPWPPRPAILSSVLLAPVFIGDPSHCFGEFRRLPLDEIAEDEFILQLFLAHLLGRGFGYTGFLQLFHHFAGRIDAMFEMYATFRADIPSGKVKVLAVASSKHHPLLADIPTAAEAGLPGYEASAWFGLVAPKGSPSEAVNRLNADMQKALKSKDVLDLLAKLAFAPRGGSPEDFGRLINGEVAKWARVIKEAGIKVDSK